MSHQHCSLHPLTEPEQPELRRQSRLCVCCSTGTVFICVSTLAHEFMGCYVKKKKALKSVKCAHTGMSFKHGRREGAGRRRAAM